MQKKIFSLLNFSFDGNITTQHFDGVYVKFDGKDAVIGYATKPQQARCYLQLAMKSGNGPFALPFLYKNAG